MTPIFPTVAVLVVLSAVAGPAEGRTYAGREAAALKCAAYLSHVPTVMEAAGLATAEDREVGLAVGLSILERHIGGTWDERLRAFSTVMGRLPNSELRLIEDAGRHLHWCLREFF